MVNINDAIYLSQAVQLAVDNVKNGGGPFGALIILADGRIVTGVNRVTATNDPTAHAEVTAIRKACELVGDFSLAGAVLYSSCEPCPMCLGAALWSRVDRVMYTADRYDALAVGFDDEPFYKLIAEGNVAERVKTSDYNAPFEQWANTEHTHY